MERATVVVVGLSLCAGLALAGCGGATPRGASAAAEPTPAPGPSTAPGPTAAAIGDPRDTVTLHRKPDGVVVDPTTERLPVWNRAPAGTLFAALRAGPAPRGVRRVVERYFSAVASEDLESLRALATDDATAGKPLNKGVGTGLLEWWRARFARLDYHPLSHLEIYRDEDLAIYGYDDLSASAANGPRPTRPLAMDPTDLLVSVPIVSTRGSAERLLGDEVLFVLKRRGEGGLAIHEVFEDFELQ